MVLLLIPEVTDSNLGQDTGCAEDLHGYCQLSTTKMLK
jgi:hypothetical protein